MITTVHNINLDSDAYVCQEGRFLMVPQSTYYLVKSKSSLSRKNQFIFSKIGCTKQWKREIRTICHILISRPISIMRKYLSTIARKQADRDINN